MVYPLLLPRGVCHCITDPFVHPRCNLTSLGPSSMLAGISTLMVVLQLSVNADTKTPVEAPSNGMQLKIRPLKQIAREASPKGERQLILESLERNRWNRKRSARELQISYKAFLYKLKQFDLVV
jgi:DNA-binding NtrC family response regulator